jgi:hypothetical protein
MIVQAQVTIHGSRAALWAAITDIDHAASIIGGIENIEIVERPATGLVGLAWRETRQLFGDPATVEKRITAASDGLSYQTRAQDSGFVFITTKRIGEGNGALILSEAHESLPQTVAARLKMIPMSLLFKGVIRKFLLQDLNDIKAAVEQAGAVAAEGKSC